MPDGLAPTAMGSIQQNLNFLPVFLPCMHVSPGLVYLRITGEGGSLHRNIPVNFGPAWSVPLLETLEVKGFGVQTNNVRRVFPNLTSLHLEGWPDTDSYTIAQVNDVAYGLPLLENLHMLVPGEHSFGALMMCGKLHELRMLALVATSDVKRSEARYPLGHWALTPQLINNVRPSTRRTEIH